MNISQPQDTRHNLAVRLLAGLWFGAFGAAASYAIYRLIFTQLNDVLTNGIFWSVFVPTFLALFFGAVFGKKVIGERYTSGGRAFGKGMLVAICAFATETLILSITLCFESGSYQSPAEMIPRVILGFVLYFFFGSIIFGWALAILGGVAGCSLHKIVRRTPKAFRAQP